MGRIWGHIGRGKVGGEGGDGHEIYRQLYLSEKLVIDLALLFPGRLVKS